MRFYKGNEAVIKPFKAVQNNKTTPVNLTGFTMKWFWTDRENTSPTGSPITATVTDATNGLFEFSIPATMLANLAKYITFINMSGIGYNEDLKPFNVEVVKGSAP